MPQQDGRRIGMYGETPRVKIGSLTICRQDPDGKDESVWIESEDGEGGEFHDSLFAPVVQEFFDKNV